MVGMDAMSCDGLGWRCGWHVETWHHPHGQHVHWFVVLSPLDGSDTVVDGWKQDPMYLSFLSCRLCSHTHTRISLAGVLCTFRTHLGPGAFHPFARKRIHRGGFLLCSGGKGEKKLTWVFSLLRCIFLRGFGCEGSSEEEVERNHHKTRVEVHNTCHQRKNIIQTLRSRRWKTCPSEPSQNSRKN